MRRHLAVFVLGLALAGCTTQKWTPPPAATQATPYALTPADTKAVEEAVRYRMKDPASTSFRNLSAVKKADGAVTVCGEVNSRNSFGGYTGFSPFTGVLTAGRFNVSAVAEDATKADFILRNCRFAGAI